MVEPVGHHLQRVLIVMHDIVIGFAVLADGWLLLVPLLVEEILQVAGQALDIVLLDDARGIEVEEALKDRMHELAAHEVDVLFSGELGDVLVIILPRALLIAQDGAGTLHSRCFLGWHPGPLFECFSAILIRFNLLYIVFVQMSSAEILFIGMKAEKIMTLQCATKYLKILI